MQQRTRPRGLRVVPEPRRRTVLGVPSVGFEATPYASSVTYRFYVPQNTTDATKQCGALPDIARRKIAR